MDLQKLDQQIRDLMPDDPHVTWGVAYWMREKSTLAHLRVGKLVLSEAMDPVDDFGEMIACITAMLGDYTVRMEGRLSPESATKLHDTIGRTLKELADTPPGVPP